MVEPPKPNNDLAKKLVERTLVLPSNENQEEYFNQVSIIRGLSTENEIIKIALRLDGYGYNYLTRRWEIQRKPVMNSLGRGNLMASLQALGDTAQFSNYSEKEIPKLSFLFFEQNYPTYLVYHKEFDLDPKDFNVIRNILQFWSLSVLKNAQGAGHRNVVRGTLSENVLARALGNNEEKPKKKGLFGWLRRNKE